MPDKKIDVDLDGVDEWFKEEVFTLLSRVVQSVADATHEAEREITELEKSGLDESFIERSVRDIKADAFDKIDQSIIDAAK